MAHRANVKLRSIENYLREDASIPKADKAVQIAQVLGVTVEYLVTGKNTSDEVNTFIEPEIQNLVRFLKKMPKKKQLIIIKNALNLAEML